MISFYFYEAAIPVLKIVQGNGILQEVAGDMVLYANIVVEFIFDSGAEWPFPFNINIASLSLGTTNHFCPGCLPGGLNHEFITPELHITDLCIFQKQHT